MKIIELYNAIGEIINKDQTINDVDIKDYDVSVNGMPLERKNILFDLIERKMEISIK